ncbi:Metallo-dependent phosphatase [Metschnikowia bicuspidata var. bicuspidata NRRL YB-4993]|uniref:Metallo-dependent phosphatase n=1 Tax=Metschnikowia bicuspidata var. bicuspidata NRRL YB-4993 TaxID=869754 RepID=A0A1A0H790_9ASCO|nr:Metallo-dependent phosphatase [Metschnikowia bicuspidata var. bicuspidata NRRL YB-4993]OBA19768.1 Metallo-dependent phosphatase [Metschnikowia bicuspidata var. bicuspidata NRRL YB-4993]
MPLLPRFRNMAGIMVLLTSLWLVLFVYHEHVVPMLFARRCLWHLVEPEAQTNVLLVADPQLIDNHTYPGRNGVLLGLSKHTVDVYLKQNYRALVTHLAPDYIVFLGDYLDNGRLALDAYFEAEFRRFERIFNRWPEYPRGDRWFTNVAGNHDIGFGDGVKLPLRERFVSHFGAANAVHSINGVDLIVLDSVSYSSSNAAISEEVRHFVRLLPPKQRPRVLLSHVPFYRDSAQLSCGPLRESRELWQNVGYQYQLELTAEVLAELLGLIQPDLIYSGDDHDYCDVQHLDATREVTVKSISMAMGIKRPAVQLLSFSAGGDTLNYHTEICYLPRPYVNVVVYVALAVCSGLLLLFSSIKLRRYVYARGQAPMSKRMSKFFEGDDSPAASLAPLSNYTKTTLSAGEKLQQQFRVWKAEMLLTLRRWNLITFFKLCAVLGLVTIGIYLTVVSFV